MEAKRYITFVGDDDKVEVRTLNRDGTVGRHLATIQDCVAGKAVWVPRRSGRTPLHVGAVGNLREAIELAAWIDEHCAL